LINVVTPSSFQTHLKDAAEAADKRDWATAAELYARAIRFDPSAGLLVQYGHMLKEAGYLDAAVKAYRSALIWDRTSTDAYVHLGHLQKRLGLIEEAIGTFEAADSIPYGPHVRPEINGLVVAQLNTKHAVEIDKSDFLKTISGSLRQEDEALHEWLGVEHAARSKSYLSPKKDRVLWHRKNIPARLEPSADVVIAGDGFRAMSKSPRMQIRPLGASVVHSLSGQWVEIRVSVSSDECLVDPVLYVEEVPGWARFKTFRLIRQSANVFGVVARLPRSVVSLRLDPVHTPGNFHVFGLKVSRLSWLSLMSKMFSATNRPAVGRILRSAWRGDLAQTIQTSFAVEMPDQYARWIALQEVAQKASLPSAQIGNVGFITLLGAQDTARYGETLASLKAQRSERWELVIVLDERSPVKVREAIASEASSDPRIKVVTCVSTASKAERLSAGIDDLATDFVGFLPVGDRLTPDAVASFLAFSGANPSAKVIFCDHDEIDDGGRRHSPHFKPDWNDDYILCHNYVGPAVVFSRSAIEAIGRWRDKHVDLETFDLLLRLSIDARKGEIGRLPQLLWHSFSHGTESEILSAVTDNLMERHSPIQATKGRVAGTVKLNWPMPTVAPHVTIIIPTRDRAELLKTAIESILLKTNYPAFDIIVVDNGSVEPESLEYFEHLGRSDRVSVLRDDGQFNFSRLNNRAVALAKGTVLALVNNDVEVQESNWLNEMVPIALDPDVGAVGAKLLYGSGHVQHAGIIGGVGTVAGHGHKYEPEDARGYMNRLVVQQTTIAVTAACLVVEANKYRAVGGMDEEHLTVAFNDVDLCLKLGEQGWRSVFTPWAVLYHHESLSRGLDLSGAKAQRFMQEAQFMLDTWDRKILRDPFYNPNLTRQHEDFSVGNGAA